MVSALWRAASDGDLDKVQELLHAASSVDVEIKDHTGATPLIQAIRNGHVEVVQILLERGADPNNNSAQGRPDTYTEDSSVLELLASARARLENAQPPAVSPPPPPQPQQQQQQYMGYGEQVPYVQYPQAYYPPPEGMGPYAGYGYMYRPEMMPQQQQQQVQQEQVQRQEQSPTQRTDGAGTGLPPPEVAKTIPCRYYPACRYGSSCMFAHPDTAPAPLPLQPSTTYTYPVQPVSYPYPPAVQPTYDYAPYYPVPAPIPGYPPYPPPPPPHQHTHTRSASEVHSPVSPGFPTLASPQVGPQMWGMPMSPYGQQVVGQQQQQVQQVQSPVVQPVLAAEEQAQSSPHPLMPPSPTTFFAPPNPNPVSSSDPAMVVLPLPLPNGPSAHRRSFSTSRSVQDVPDLSAQGGETQHMGQAGTGYFRGAGGRGRGGAARRQSYLPGGRQPPSNIPCMFFPTGKCKNGESCRFAHVMPGPDDPVPYPSSRPYKSRASLNNSSNSNSNSNSNNPMSPTSPNGPPTFASIHSPPHTFPNGHSGRTNTSASASPTTGAGSTGTFERLRAERNGNGNGNGNGSGGGKHPTAASSRASSVASRQRVPNADDFPALGGAPPAYSSAQAQKLNGPTAAQVLQAPAPGSGSGSGGKKARSHSGSSEGKGPGKTDGTGMEIASRLEAVTVGSSSDDVPMPSARESEAVFA